MSTEGREDAGKPEPDPVAEQSPVACAPGAETIIEGIALGEAAFSVVRLDERAETIRTRQHEKAQGGIRGI